MAEKKKDNQAPNPKIVTPNQSRAPVTKPRYRKRVHKLVYSTYFRIVFSAILIFLLFTTGALIAYQSEIRKKASEDFEKEVPEAEIIIPSPEPSSDVSFETDTSDWKNFTNEDYNFVVTYPPAWELTDNLSTIPPQLEFGMSGPTQTTPLEFTDGVSLKFFPGRSTPEEESLSTLKSYGNLETFTAFGWKGYRAQSKSIDGNSYDAVSASIVGPSATRIEMFWLHFDPSNNELRAEDYLFPILSSFQFLE